MQPHMHGFDNGNDRTSTCKIAVGEDKPAQLREGAASVPRLRDDNTCIAPIILRSCLVFC